jgi:F-type H+-transporting ATPase subunit delta
MDEPLTKDARELVEGVVTYLRDETREKSVVPKVERFLGKLTVSAKKEKVARVESSVSLTADEVKKIELTLKKHIGYDVTVKNIVTPDVIGGLRIQVADWIVDTTFQTQLSRIAATLL